MRTSRLEAFSDGVLAIIITIMVLELHVPEGDDWQALGDSATSFLTYALSFIYVGIYWNNHHHMFQVIEYVSGGVLWANLHLLFWLSLFPFSTGWMDESGFARVPTVVYGINLLLAAIAFYLVEVSVMAGRGGSRLAAALGRDLKGKLSQLMYITGIALVAVAPWLGVTTFVIAALVWLVPDSRVARFLEAESAAAEQA
jgi:uncharacterized membrane protein